MADQIADIQEAITEAENIVDRPNVSRNVHCILSYHLRNLRHHVSKLVPDSRWDPKSTNAVILSETLKLVRSIHSLNESELRTSEPPLLIHVYLSKALLDLRTPVDPEIDIQSLKADVLDAIVAFDQHLNAALEGEVYERIWDDVRNLRRAVNNAESSAGADTLCVVRNLLHSLTKSPQASYQMSSFSALSLGLQWCAMIVGPSTNSNNVVSEQLPQKKRKREDAPMDRPYTRPTHGDPLQDPLSHKNAPIETSALPTRNQRLRYNAINPNLVHNIFIEAKKQLTLAQLCRQYELRYKERLSNKSLMNRIRLLPCVKMIGGGQSAGYSHDESCVVSCPLLQPQVGFEPEIAKLLAHWVIERTEVDHVNLIQLLASYCMCPDYSKILAPLTCVEIIPEYLSRRRHNSATCQMYDWEPVDKIKRDLLERISSPDFKVSLAKSRRNLESTNGMWTDEMKTALLQGATHQCLEDVVNTMQLTWPEVTKEQAVKMMSRLREDPGDYTDFFTTLDMPVTTHNHVVRASSPKYGTAKQIKSYMKGITAQTFNLTQFHKQNKCFVKRKGVGEDIDLWTYRHDQSACKFMSGDIAAKNAAVQK